jgi:hypothetical protein
LNHSWEHHFGEINESFHVAIYDRVQSLVIDEMKLHGHVRRAHVIHQHTDVVCLQDVSYFLVRIGIAQICLDGDSFDAML